MKTVRVDEIFKDGNKTPYGHDLFWMIIWIVLALFVRTWGNLFERVVTLLTGSNRRTTLQLVIMAFGTLILVFYVIRCYDICLDRSRKKILKS